MLAEGITLSEQVDLPGAAPAIRVAPDLLSSATDQAQSGLRADGLHRATQPSSADRHRGF